MAFEIEALTAEQREQFAAKQIPDPLSPVLGILKPRRVDHRCGKRCVFVCNRRASGLPE